MANQTTTKASSVFNSECSDDEMPDISIKYFKWTARTEKSLLFNMIRLKPCGINKHLNMLLLKEKLYEELKINIPSKLIWKYLEKTWNIGAADSLENTTFSTSDEELYLPEEYDNLIAVADEKIRTYQKKESLNDEVYKKQLFSGQLKSRAKSNSMSSEDSNDGLNETFTSSLSENSPTKTNENGLEEIPTTRRSLRTNDKHEEKELDDSSNKRKFLRLNRSDELNKLKNLKVTNKKTSYQSKDLEKNEKLTNARNQKRKNRNVSESSFSSDNGKQPTNHKNNLTDITVSDSSSRSVTPEIPRGKTYNRSITPETINRKSNLRSSDKNQKSKLSMQKPCLQKLNHSLLIPKLRHERVKTEKKYSTLLESKSKNSIQNINELNNIVKGKTRGRVTSDLLVAQQFSDVQSLGRRSCSNKNL